MGTDPAGGAVEWVPTHDRQHPPFEAGNEVARTHGAYSQRVVGPVADALVAAVHADSEVRYLNSGSYQPALRAWAAAEARVIVLAEYIDRIGLEAALDSGKGRTPLLEQLRQWEATALTHRSRLGLDPLSRARLGRDVAATRVDVAAVLTRMREDAEQEGGDPK